MKFHFEFYFFGTFHSIHEIVSHKLVWQLFPGQFNSFLLDPQAPDGLQLVFLSSVWVHWCNYDTVSSDFLQSPASHIIK